MPLLIHAYECGNFKFLRCAHHFSEFMVIFSKKSQELEDIPFHKGGNPISNPAMPVLDSLSKNKSHGRLVIACSVHTWILSHLLKALGSSTFKNDSGSIGFCSLRLSSIIGAFWNANWYLPIWWQMNLLWYNSFAVLWINFAGVGVILLIFIHFSLRVKINVCVRDGIHQGSRSVIWSFWYFEGKKSKDEEPKKLAVDDKSIKSASTAKSSTTGTKTMTSVKSEEMGEQHSADHETKTQLYVWAGCTHTGHSESRQHA